ncbi:MAG: hypothetical protein ACR2KD_04045 [Thermoleophilaceae bacterium]
MTLIVFLLTAVIQLVVAALGFFMLLLGLNGYSEADATPGIVFYFAVSLLCAFGLGAASAVAAKRLAANASLGRLGALAIAVSGFSLAGVVVLSLGWGAALTLAEVARTWG